MFAMMLRWWKASLRITVVLLLQKMQTAHTDTSLLTDV